MSITWATPTPNPKMQTQGPALVYYGAYTAAGADTSSTTFAGIMSAKDGVEWNFKQTFNATEIQQSTYAFQHFLTKQECTFKFTLSHMDPAIMNVMFGFQSGSYTAAGGAGQNNTQKLQDYFDATSSSSVPNARPPYKQILIRFPSSGFDNTNSPIGGWGYWQIWKGFFTPAGSPKIGRDNLWELPVTITTALDVSVSVPAVGQWITGTPTT